MNIIKKQTASEVALEKELEKQGVDVIPQYNDGYKRVDLRVTDAKVDIEVDGIQHLINPNQIDRDMNRSYYSHKDGYSTIHIPNKELQHHLKRIAWALAKAIKSRILKIKFKNKSASSTEL